MASESSSFLAVVPAYNEAAIDRARWCDSLQRACAPVRRDRDRRRLDRRHRHSARAAAGASVIRLPFNLGIGGAVQTGFMYALEHDYDYMAQVDGDGQHEPAELDKLVDAIEADPTLDMVCGSRFLSDDSDYPAPISRRTGIHLFAFTLSKILGQRVTDPTSGFRLYNRRAIALFARDYPHDYPEVEAVLMLHAHRLRDDRGAGADASARRRAVVDHEAPLVLLHGQGLAGTAGRAAATPAGRRAR